MNNGSSKIVSYDDIAGVNIKDSNGEITRVPYSQAKEMGLVSSPQDMAAANKRTAYKAIGGGYTTDLTKADFKSSITLDKDTGKITISAPQSVLDDKSFDEVFNPNVLKQLSSAYQRNQNYKIPDPFDESDDRKDLTVPEIIKKYDENIKNFVAALQQEEQTRRDIASGKQGYSNRNNIANRLTRNDMIIMGTNALGEGANDNSLISIPKFMYEDVNFLESFNAESGDVKKGDFRKNVFSLIKKDEDYINSLYDRLEEYFAENDFEDTEEYARATALYSFLTNNDPDATPGQIANYVTSSLIKGFGYEFNKTIGQTADAFLGASPEYLEAEYADEDAYIAEAEKFLSRMSTAGSIALGVGKIGGSLGSIIPLSTAAGNAAGSLAATANAARTVTAALSTAKRAETTAASIAATAEELAIGADMLLAANNVARAAEIGATAAKIASTSSRIGTIVDLAAQTIAEAVMTDPVVFAKILQNQERAGQQAATNEDAYGLLLETAAWNIGGWGAFTIGAKGIKSFGKTSAGRYTNAVAQKYLNKVSVSTGSLGERVLKLRYGDEWLDASRSVRKNEARKYNYELRQAQRDIANQKIGSPFSKSAAQNIKKQEENIINLMRLHNATDAVQRGAKAYIRRTLNSSINPKLSGYEQKLRALGAKITKAERKLGLSTRKKLFRREDVGVVRVFSKESANYIGARTQLDVLENIKRIRGGLTDVQKKAEEILTRKLAEAKAKLPAELQEALEEYLGWDRRFWQEYNNIRVREGSLNAKQIDELRAEGYWGENGELYRPSYRVDPDKKTKLVRNDDRVARDNDTATEQYVWGSEKDFMDPEVARYMGMGDAGTTLNSTRYIEALNAMPSSKAHVVYDAEEVARAQRMKDVRKPLGARIKNVTKGVFKTGKIKTGESVEKASTLYKMRKNWIKQAGETTSSKLSLARASTKKIKLTTSERRSVIEAMNRAQLDDVLAEAGVEFNFSRMKTPEEFEAFYNSLDKTTQKYVQQKMGNVAGVLYPADTSANTLDRAVAKANKLKEEAQMFNDSGVKVKKVPIGEYEVELDYTIADRISELNKAGYDTYNSHSGISAEHNAKSDIGKGYIQFNGNLSPEKIENIKLAADKANMSVVEELNPVYGKTITVYQDKAADGTLSSEIINQANQLTYKKMNVPKSEAGKEWGWIWNLDNEGFKKALDYRSAKVKELYKKHGGDALPDDAARNESWDKFFDSLGAKTSKAEPSTQILLVKDAPYITAENYNKLAQMDSIFVPGIKKSLLQNQKNLRDSDAVTRIGEEGKRAQLIAEREGLYKENLAKLNQITKDGLNAKNQEAILAELDSGVTEYLDEVYADKKLSQTIDDIIEQSGTVDKEAAREYIVLEEMLRDETQELRELRQVARDELRGESEKEKISDMFERMFEEKVYDRRNIARQKLADENSTLVDRKSWMEEIRKLDKDITGKLSEPGYVSVPNSKGEMEVWEVDPIASDLYKYAARQPDMNAIAKFFNTTSKIFRLGTTGLNLMSFVNQSFRDFGNLWLTSGSYHMINLSRADMVDMVGPEIADWYLREEPEVYSQLLKQAERRGQSIESMVIERELAIGRETSTQATETALLKTVGDASATRKIKAGEMSRTNQALDRVIDKLSSPNEWRERYFRNIVYADSLDQALKRGYTLKQARVQAEFMMNNATTNFSRQMVHLQAWQRTVPYIGAAVNGTKSFFRILSVDPVGVMSRLVGGFVIPVMALTGMALADPKARKKYEQLNEYEKDNNLIVPVNGSLMKVPIPQEVGPLVKPWQHLVEKMWDSNRHDFWELMLNDALGISPIDITGFYDLDQDAMENPTIWDRMENGVVQLVVGQMSPVPLKATYMLATGKDPYTGKFIDTSYQYYDYESGEVVPMDTSQSAFAQMMANSFGGPASVIAAVTTSLLGRTGTDILDVLTSAGQYLATGGEEGSLTTILQRAGESISKPITVAEYDRTKTAWNREISALYREKEAILNSDKYQKIEQAINQETNPQKLKSLKAQRQDMLDDWYERTKVAINKLQDNFGGTIDRYRMASLISLLNMHEDTGGIGVVGRAANDELFYEGRDEAIRALIDMGANETGDASILGYLTRVRHNDGTETTEVKFYKPLEILAMQNAWYNNASVSASYIKELLEDGPIDYKSQRKAIKQQRDAIYAKGKLSQKDYNAINAIEIEWNARVMQAISPYIERVTPESALNDTEVIDYLKELIFVPSEFKKDKRGYYVTNKSLGGGSANEAYIKKYLQSVYKVNDTGYVGGRNYSGRQSLGGQ